MSKVKNLQQALNQSAASAKPTPLLEVASEQNNATPKPATGKTPSREGKVNIAAWLKPDFKSSLRLVQISKGHGAYLDDIIAEALNDLFRKYDVPTVQHD